MIVDFGGLTTSIAITALVVGISYVTRLIPPLSRKWLRKAGFGGSSRARMRLKQKASAAEALP
jgi:hypothetical protein